MKTTSYALRSRRVFSFLTAATCLQGGIALAQTTPPPPPPGASAGVLSSQALRRQEEALRAPRPDASAAEDAPSVVAPARPPAAAAPESSLRFQLRSVSFGPSAFLSRDALQAVAAPYLNRDVSLADLNAIVAGVNALYDARGLVTARALLAPQAVQGGEIRIDLIEGKVGAITVSGARQRSVEAAIRRTGLKPGDTVDVAALRRRLSLLNRTTDTQARVALQPGERFGLTDIQLSVIEPPRNLVQMIGDNYGYDSAGRFQASLYARRTGIFGNSDRATGYASGSDGARAASLSYDVPLFGPASRLGASYGFSKTEIVNGAFAAVNSRGRTESGSINYSQPLASSEYGILLGSLSTGFSRTRNYLSGTYQGQSRTVRAGGGLTYSLARPGRSAEISVNALWADASIPGSTGRKGFAMVSGTASGEALLSPVIGLHAAGGWQIPTERNLPGDLLFQIGGGTTVRGYRQGELTGYGGYYANFELEIFPLRAPGPLTVIGFVDTGKISTALVQSTALTAAGAGFSWAVAPRLNLRLTAAAPLRRVNDQAPVMQVFGRIGVTF